MANDFPISYRQQAKQEISADISADSAVFKTGDTSHYVFFQGGHLAKSTHLGLLLFHLLLQTEKHMKKSFISAQGLGTAVRTLCSEAEKD